MKISSKGKRECLFLLFLMAFFLFIFIGALDFPPDAKLFPLVLSVPCVLASIVLIIKTIINERIVEEPVIEKEGSFVKRVFPFVFSIVYFILVYVFGYMISTLAVMIFTPYILGYKKKGVIIAGTVIIFVIVVGVFNILLSMRTYKGLLGLI